MAYQPIQQKPGKQLPACSEYVNYISNFSRQQQRIQLVSANDNIMNGSQIQFDLPASALLDMDTLVLKGLVTIKTTAGVAWWPKDAVSAISRITVETTTMVLDSGLQDTNILAKILLDHSAGGVENQREIMQLGRGFAPVAGAAAGAALKAPKEWGGAPQPTAGNYTQVPFIITDLLGFLNSQDSYFLTDLVGNVRVTLYLAGPEILARATNATAGAFWYWDKVYASIQTLSVDPVYFQSTSMLLAQGQVISKRFQSWHSQRGAPMAPTTQTLTFGVSSQSVDLILATLVRDSTTNAGHMAAVGGCYGDSSPYFDRDGSAVENYQFSINNSYIPQYNAENRFEAFPSFMHSMGELEDLTTTVTHSIRSLSDATNSPIQVWTKGFFCLGVSLHPQADPSMRVVGGYDSRGSSATIRVILQGENAAQPLMPIIFVRTTPVLKIAANKLHEVVR